MADTGRRPERSLCGVWRRTTARFFAETSLAGANNAGRARHRLGRLAWGVLWLAGLAATLSHVMSIVDKYLHYPITTDYRIQYRNSVHFPAVTVCNQNSVMCNALLEQLFQTPDDHALQRVVYLSDCKSNLDNYCSEPYKMLGKYLFVPELVQDWHCFTNDATNCAGLAGYGKREAEDVRGPLELLGCEPDDWELPSAGQEEEGSYYFDLLQEVGGEDKTQASVEKGRAPMTRGENQIQEDGQGNLISVESGEDRIQVGSEDDLVPVSSEDQIQEGSQEGLVPVSSEEGQIQEGGLRDLALARSEDDRIWEGSQGLISVMDEEDQIQDTNNEGPEKCEDDQVQKISEESQIRTGIEKDQNRENIKHFEMRNVRKKSDGARRSGSRERHRRDTKQRKKKPGMENHMGKDYTHDATMDFYASFMSLSLKTRQAIGQTFFSFIKACSYNGKDCLNSAYFKPISTANYGTCFTFNSILEGEDSAGREENSTMLVDTSAGKLKSTLTGPHQGLSLILYLNITNHMPAAMSQTLGARVTIHPSDVSPLVDEGGMDLTPATVTSASLSQTHIRRKRAPYPSNCFSDWSQSGVEPVVPGHGNRSNGERFTLHKCDRICTQLKIVRACGCHHTLFPLAFTVAGKLQDIKHACHLSFGTKESKCTERVFNGMGPGRLEGDCVCSNPCDEVQHQQQLSMAYWPHGAFLDDYLKRIGMLGENQTMGTISSVLHASDFIKLNVYFRDINVAVVTESAVYTYTTLISSLGGALSLYLGIALIVLLELLEYVFILAVNTCLFLCGRYRDDGMENGTAKTDMNAVAPVERRPSVKIILNNKSTTEADTRQIPCHHGAGMYRN